MEEKLKKDIIKLFAFIFIANLPFISIVNLVGMDTFLDSFENPTYYQYIKNDKIEIKNSLEGYVFLQKQTHPDFTVTPGDLILYVKDEGGLACQKIYYESYENSLKKYYSIYLDENHLNMIGEEQIVGKVLKSFDNNPISSLSLKIWDASVNNLNVAALFTQK